MSARSTERRSRPAELRDLTDWERVRNMTEEEIEANAASDPDNPPWTEEELRGARTVQPGSGDKPLIWVHVDEDVREWVRARLGDTDQMINDLLRAVMEKEKAALTAEEKLALVDRIRAMQARPLEDDSADLIRDDRDSR